MTSILRVNPDDPAELLHARGAVDGRRHAVVTDIAEELSEQWLELLIREVETAGVATASPVPAGSHAMATYDLHELLPPSPSLALPCRSLCVLGADALASLGDDVALTGTVRDQLVILAERFLQQGWRHVATPGLAMRWDPADATGITPTAAWSPSTIANLSSSANAGLETHRTWAESRLGGTKVMIDGACLTGDLHTGTQHLVLEVSRWLQATRPTGSIIVATPASSIASVERMLDGTDVAVVDRSHADQVGADVLYRPYQMLRIDELALNRSAGRRRLIGQLDMIGFSNPFYHPSGNLFAFARNLQRHLMRNADGVTFISSYGRAAAVAECPDLETQRLHVVSCGADPTPETPRRPIGVEADEEFIVCLSATFWHKNRQHAIATFSELVRSSGFDGSLVIAGPEPFYGRSTGAEDLQLAQLPAEQRSRVRRLGQVSDSEKWWLLQHARAVIYPSIVEGFGLVPFEAAAVDTPCLAFAGTAQGELLADTEATIDSWEPARWATRVNSWLRDPAAGAAVVADVTAVARRHTWRRCAERTWTAIDAALAQPRRAWPGDEDGGLLTRVGASRSTASTVRFTVARAQPAITHRLRRTAVRMRRNPQ